VKYEWIGLLVFFFLCAAAFRRRRRREASEQFKKTSVNLRKHDLS
jgi:hypothetical protein